ncbi:hypothetical protein MRB53_001962 [Persea americana]|uniref:Uncharacterized protein n=1 Tax=Persea americana TaxID=3435 RepID=A0ACC2MTA5_PERAE|nr:hypothetical protein MRB53_001962 [Persea americana]
MGFLHLFKNGIKGFLRLSGAILIQVYKTIYKGYVKVESFWIGYSPETGSRAKQRLQASISPKKIVQIWTTSLRSIILRQSETTTPCPASPEIEKNRWRLPVPNFWLQSFGKEHKRKKTKPS